MKNPIFRTLAHTAAHILLGSALLVALFFADHADASDARQIIGHLRNKGPAQELQLSFQGGTYTIKARPALITILRYLKDGNYITATGTVYPEQKAVVLDSVESLGLKELLGSWRANTRLEIFTFENFNSMAISYISFPNSGPIELNKSVKLSYVVTPEDRNRYSIYMTDQRSVMLGSLRIGDRQMTLEVFDNDTGRVSDNISLSPFPLP